MLPAVGENVLEELTQRDRVHVDKIGRLYLQDRWMLLFRKSDFNSTSPSEQNGGKEPAQRQAECD
jgi:hypothetical protein